MGTESVRAVRYTATGACGVGRARIAGLVLTATAGAGRLTITEGSGGPVRLDLDISTNTTYYLEVPQDGVLCAVDPFISVLTNVSAVTIFFV